MSLNKFTIQKSFAINAGAGSGKTYTLSRRYINAILGFDFFREPGFSENYYDDLKPATTKQIVTITYTEAAALEMKERIFGLISKIINHKTLKDGDGDKESILNAFEALNNEQNKYVISTLEKALKQSSDAKISTIHSYCLDILKSNADIVKFDASIDIVKDDEKDKIINEAKFLTLNNSSNEKTIQELSTYLNLYFLDTIFKMYATSSTFRAQFNSFDETSFNQEKLKELLRDIYKLQDVSDDYDILCDRFRQDNLEEKHIKFLEAYIENFKNFEAVSWSELSNEFDVAIQFHKKPFNKMKELKEYVNNIKSYESFISVYQEIDEEKEALFYKKIVLLKSLMNQVKDIYDQKILELGKLDFDEIISKTHEIIKQVKIDVKYMMVDEFQDTNSVQYEIVKNSLNANSNLFVVGDSKQSIYSFQGAEIEVFNDAISDKAYISSIEPMDVNYRSDGVVLDNVNAVFKKLLQPNEDIILIKQNYEATPQAIKVSKPSKKEQGSFNFLINSNDTNSEDDDSNEYEQIANFIANIKYGKLKEFDHIKNLIEENNKAIAVVFDSSTKMLELKAYLNQNNIECKVSASENFYHTKEVNDIFNILMYLQFPRDKFYKASALRSSILRYSDSEIYKILSEDQACDELKVLRERFEKSLLSDFILYIYQTYVFKELQENFTDSEQRKANLDKFLLKAVEHENINGNDTFSFLKQCEKNIYFSEAKEDEAFFKSNNLESIQLCTIHSTKGLAYPMVIVANSDKNIYTQIQSDSIKSNSFTLTKNNERKLITGFKVDGYEPLCFRLLKQIDKFKHLAEKKRLLYVALTRAEHDIVVSGSIKKKVDGSYSLSDTSYLGMIADGLDLEADALYNHGLDDSITNLEEIEMTKEIKIFNNEEVKLKPLVFEELTKTVSATKTEDIQELNVESNAARLGTITHEIFELYWDRFDEINLVNIFNKYEIIETKDKNQITTSIDRFTNSEVFQLLKDGVEHRFELEFNYKDKTGFIDLVYFDERKNGWVIVDFKTGKETEEKEMNYQKQLDFYEDVLNELKMSVAEKRILWV